MAEEKNLAEEIEEIESSLASVRRDISSILELSKKIEQQQVEILSIIQAPPVVSLKLTLGTPIPQ